MSITFEEIVKKYDTNIDLKKVSTNLKKTIILSDELNYNISDLKKPKYTFSKGKDTKEIVETYRYELRKGDIIEITYAPSNYRTMEVIFEQEHDFGPMPYTRGWDYKGNPIVF